MITEAALPLNIIDCAHTLFCFPKLGGEILGPLGNPSVICFLLRDLWCIPPPTFGTHVRNVLTARTD
jgi:hypothetical protein